jgi:hypothetical protein
MRDADLYRISFQTLRRMRQFRDGLRRVREVEGPHFAVDCDTARLHLREYMKLCQEYVVMAQLLGRSQRNVFGAIMVKYPGSELGWVMPIVCQEDARHTLAMQQIHERLDFDDYERLVNSKWSWHAQRINLMLRSELTLNGIIAFKLTM